MAKIRTIFEIAKGGLHVNRGRTILTILGIVIGIALVIIVMSAGSAIESFITAQLEAFGPDIIDIEIKAPGQNNAVGVAITTLKDSDKDEVKKNDNIVDAYAGVISQAVVAHDGQAKKIMIFGVSAAYPNVDSVKFASGRFYTEQEEKGVSRVVVIGSKVKEKFFPNQEAVGEQVRINQINYRIVGVLKEQGAIAFFDRDNLVYIPLKTVQKLIDGIDHVSFIIAKMENIELGAQTRTELEVLLRERHNIDDPDKDDFFVTTVEDAQEILGTVVSAVKLLLLALAAISLVVGGVGIMNIMYVSVNERTYEIGLRKSIGATNKDILRQFLTEAVIMTLVGGVIGIVLGGIASYMIALFANSKGFDWPLIIGLDSVLVAVGFSVLVGIVFGLYPSRKAAKLNPIDALRYE